MGVVAWRLGKALLIKPAIRAFLASRLRERTFRGDSEAATELGDPAGNITEKRMSNVFKFDPNAIRERRRLNDKSPPKSAKEAEEMLARKDSRRAWLLFVGAAILLTILKTVLHIG